MNATIRARILSTLFSVHITLGVTAGFAAADVDTAINSEYSAQNEEPIKAGTTEPDFGRVSSGTLFLNNNNGNTIAPLLGSSVKIDISGLVAKIVLTQTFRNTSAEWVEGIYTFPLPDQAAVNALEVTIGQRRIMGKIKEKKQANREFARARREGKVAALVSQHRPNLFSSRFANIAPGEKISIQLTYIQTVAFDNAKYRLRIPLTLTPRFSNTLVADQQAISPPFIGGEHAMRSETIDHTVNISGNIYGEYQISQFNSPTHSLDVNATTDQLAFSLGNKVKLDRDFILEWTLPDKQAPVVRAWRETVSDQQYLLASIVPPKNTEFIPEQPRELILIIDTSGSMAGAAIEAAKDALMSALSGLKTTDKFNIIEFNSNHSSVFHLPQPANEKNLMTAQRFIQSLHAEGGTQMLPALQRALGYQQSGILRQVVFVTDGSIGYEDSVITAVTKQLRNARLFTVGIGTAPNQWFMRKVAQAGRGSAEFISNIDEVVPVMGDLLYKLEAPALTNIIAEFDDSQTSSVPNPIPDLYANDAVIVAAKLGEQSTLLTLTGQWGGNIWRERIQLHDAPMVNTGLSTIWAQRTIESLNDQQRTHNNPDFYRSVILGIALEHKLLSRYTSFIATEENPSRPLSSDLVAKTVPNLIPHGNDMLEVAMPRGAAGSDTRILLGFLLALTALSILYISERKNAGKI